MTNLTKKQIHNWQVKYRRKKPHKCPICEDELFIKATIKPWDGVLNRLMICANGHKWTEHYRLVFVTIDDDTVKWMNEVRNRI